MFISDFAIRRPLVTVVAMLSLVLFGFFAWRKLKTDECPDVAPPWLTVAVIYPGASPEGVEKEVLDPIEEQVASIAGVKRIMSKAYDGYALLMIEFLFAKDLNGPHRPADRDGGADHPEVQRHGSADRVAGAQLRLALAGRADAPRRSRH